MANKSLKFVKRQFRKAKPIIIDPKDFPNMFATGSYIQNLVANDYKRIWTETMKCQMKDKDSGMEREVIIKYDPEADFQFMETVFVFDIMDLSGTDGYINSMNQAINNVLWNNVDIRPGMPEHYDLDSEKEAYKKWTEETDGYYQPLEEHFEGVKETYFDYDVHYTIGDFVCFKDSKESYKLEWESYDKSVKDILADNPNVNPTRYIVALPIKIEYIAHDVFY